MPEGAVFKGYQPTIIQDIVITPNNTNTQFNREIYYSPLLKRTFIAPLPVGYAGDFGPNLKALILDMHHHEEMTEASLHNFLTTQGIDISDASISRIFTDKQASFYQEKKEIVSAGLRSTQHQQMKGLMVLNGNSVNHGPSVLYNMKSAK